MSQDTLHAIESLTDYQAIRVLDCFSRQAQVFGVGAPQTSLDQAEIQASALIESEYPEQADALRAAHATYDPTLKAEAAQNLLAELAAAEHPATDALLHRCLESTSQLEIDPAGIELVLLGVGLLILLQTRFQVSFSSEKGERVLHVDVEKKPTSEKLIAKVLRPFGL